MELTDLTITQTHQRLVKKEFSALELCQAYLERIQKKDKEIFSYLTITEDLALQQAKAVDEKIKKGEKIGILSGIPCAIKDNILVQGIKCTAGSKILENYAAPYDAAVIKKLKKQGAVILGKTNLDEFAMGASGENSAFGPTKNPRDLTRVPGGSSAGSAAAVASRMSCYALGSDTAGSIREPASFCGLVGLKPSYGAVSRYGLIAMACSLDQIGPLTKTVEDAKIVFDAIKGKDELDSTSVELNSKSQVPNPKQIPNSKFQIQNLRIGVPKEYFIKGIDPEVERIIRGAIKKIENLGAKIEEISLPHTEYSVATYYIITPCEISANLARYDGIKYGFSKVQSSKTELPFMEAKVKKRAKSSSPFKVQGLLDVYLQSRGEGLGQEVKRRIMLGTYALSAGYYEAYYLRAQKVRTLIRKDFEKAFEKVDAIFTPVSPSTAFKLGEKIEDPLLMYLCDVFTGPVSLAGLPGISIPAGKIGNLPVGLQIIGKPFEEEKILDIGKIFEQINQYKSAPSA